MSKTKEQLFEELCQLIEPFNTQNIALTPATDIATDLSIDSVAIMDFVMEIEDRFDIDIPLNLLAESRTMEDMVEIVQQRMAAGTPS